MKYLLSVARSRNCQDMVVDIEMKVVLDVLMAICFVFTSDEDRLHILNREYRFCIDMHSRSDPDMYDGSDHGMPERNLERYYRKYSASFPNWMKYVEGSAEQEMFKFLFIAYYECLERYPEYSDASLRPYFKALVEKLCTEDSSRANLFEMRYPLESLPTPFLLQQINYFINREKELENQLSKSEMKTIDLRIKLKDAEYELHKCQMRIDVTPDREYLVKESGGPYRVMVYEPLGKVQKYRDVELIIRDIVSEVLAVSTERVTPGADFFMDLGADSLGLMELSIKIEDALDLNDVNLENDVFGYFEDDVMTFGDAVKYVYALQSVNVETHEIASLDELLGESYEQIK